MRVKQGSNRGGYKATAKCPPAQTPFRIARLYARPILILNFMHASAVGLSATKGNGVASDIRRIRRMRVKCFGVADRWFERLVRFIKVMHEGF